MQPDLLQSSAGVLHAPAVRRPHSPVVRPQILGVGTATPPHAYTQREVLELFGIEDKRIRDMFLNSAIQRRHLCLPPARPDGSRALETQAELLHKHKTEALEIGAQALTRCLERSDLTLDQVDYLCCVTTTGFLTPALSALFIKQLGLPRNTSRVDVVGMGCNAGLNALNAVASWAQANPGKVAVMLCVEICSAAYVFDGSMETAVVNSLFGDGTAAIALRASPDRLVSAPTLQGFASCVISEAVDAMRFDWDECHGKFSFALAQDVPYVVGANVESVVNQLLKTHGLRRSEIDHWLVHSGGKKVIDSIKVNLGLTAHDVRHTTGVLRDYGNVSSGSFLFSYERLLEEGVVAAGDRAVMMTMGPGSTIETALLHW